MKLLKYFLIIPAFIIMVGCSEEKKPISEEKKVDLSAGGLANCYIVSTPGKYCIKADNQFNLGPGLPVPHTLNPASAKLIWQSVRGSVSDVELIEKDGGDFYIDFKIEKAEGNALIAVLNATGDIEWSWHIWMPQVAVESISSSTGYEVMTLNLGAMNNTPGDPSSYGFLYQWGRKDPFPASATLTGDTSTIGAPLYDINNNSVVIYYSNWYDNSSNTIDYSIAHPTTVLSNYSQYNTSRDWLRPELSNDALWGNPNGEERNFPMNTFINKGIKTCYDPSPAGWRVAPPDAFCDLTPSGSLSWDIDEFNVADINGDGRIDLNDFNYGWSFYVNPTQTLYFPAAARYDGSYAMLMGSVSGIWGNYWSNSPYSNINGGAFCHLSFQTKGSNGEDIVTLSPSAGSSRADAFSIRCVRDL